MASTKTTIDPSHLNWYAAREPLVLIILSAAAISFFFAVIALSRIYNAQQAAHGAEWFQRGKDQLNTGRPELASKYFQVALTYVPGDFQYQLSLAQSLLALNNTEQALQYLGNLWQRQPENGTVNLELARIYAGKDDLTRALRYYHNAIYAIWNEDPEAQRRAVRLELAEFLLKRQAHGQAESELIALQGTLPDDPQLIAHLGDLFMQIPDYERALAEYKKSLKLMRRNPAALAGAGHAAFELARYRDAEGYLKSELGISPADNESASLLEAAQLVLEMNPYRAGLSSNWRKRIVTDAFNAAGARLKSCLASVGANQSAAAQFEPLNSQWLQMQPKVSRRTFDQDTMDAAMDLVFRLERESAQFCGAPQGKDRALLLISQSREGD